MIKKRVVVAMSGGVDSSVAAALLLRQGYEVIGMTMCFNLADAPRRKPACCGVQGIEDARRVCHKLGIRHYAVNMQEALQEKVIKDFLEEYLKGRTPNPCVRCNQFLKFDVLLKKALSLGAKFLATGHYCRIADGLLKKARDLKKDQSYFLYRLSQAQLRHILFPLGEYAKDEVRQLARKFGLAVADKTASQEICFLPEVDYRPFLKRWLGKRIYPGDIVDKHGKVLGEHRGIAYYTVGQREGLGIALGYPAYITYIDAKRNIITIGPREEVFKQEFLVSNPHFLVRDAKKKIAVKVRIRYNHPETSAKIRPQGRNLLVRLLKPQFAITPGQAAVFYHKDEILGGGTIERVLK